MPDIKIRTAGCNLKPIYHILVRMSTGSRAPFQSAVIGYTIEEAKQTLKDALQELERLETA